MTTFSRSPLLLKGQILVDPSNTQGRKQTINFLYNPDSLTRTLRAQTTGSDNAARGEVLRLTAPPQETIRISVEIDATNQLEEEQKTATTLGIHPTLAALELLLYPNSKTVKDNEKLMARGEREIIPPEAPLTLFVWGKVRVLPVRITSLSITEEAFDPNLNPIRAKVAFDLRVLNYQDLGLSTEGGAKFMTHQETKEGMAKLITEKPTA